MAKQAGRSFGVLASTGLSFVLGCPLVDTLPLCTGPDGTVCAEGEFCRYPPGSCGEIGRIGLCVALPEVCPEIFAPVCGCDGNTYGNPCEAWAQGVSVRSEGECDTNGPGAFCGGIAGVACDAGDYCHFEPGVCGDGDQSGKCEPIPDFCTEEFAPVCGCDDRTYDNACFAAMAEVSVRKEGECGGPG